MTDNNIQKIQETIRNLQDLKEQDVLSAELADASIAALKKKLESFHAILEGNGAIAQGAGAKAVGTGGILVEGDVNNRLAGDTSTDAPPPDVSKKKKGKK